eukprot:TRINITY_DN20681_c0_g1_i1.p1 TRINITY_DN20681_c0_g1~~TRINITY_DN20681_c0_g1_i1.p1  ORF type:complete len:164 (+),score=17.41 TRINITY_DN20681_c0_g1_i1:64-492(+)
MLRAVTQVAGGSAGLGGRRAASRLLQPRCAPIQLSAAEPSARQARLCPRCPSASSSTGAPRESVDEVLLQVIGREPVALADARVLLVVGALCCFAGSLASVYVAVTHDPNRKEDRPILKRGEYLAGASVVGALGMMYVIMKR